MAPLANIVCGDSKVNVREIEKKITYALAVKQNWIDVTVWRPNKSSCTVQWIQWE